MAKPTVWERLARAWEPPWPAEEPEAAVEALAERLAGAYPDPERQEWVRKAVREWAKRRTR
jgi:hypothetical protein